MTTWDDLAVGGPQVKAMVIRKYVDHMITLAKDGSLHARRQVSQSTHGMVSALEM